MTKAAVAKAAAMTVYGTLSRKDEHHELLPPSRKYERGEEVVVVENDEVEMYDPDDEDEMYDPDNMPRLGQKNPW